MWILWIPILIVALFYIGVPLLVWRTHRFPVDPQIDETALRDIPDEEARRYLAKSTDTLAADGFTPSEPMLVPGPTKQIISAVVLLEHATTQDLALVACTLNRTSDGRVSHKASFTEFATFFPGDAGILTNNSPILGAFDDAKRETLRCPGIVSLGVLYKVHRARVERSPLNKQPRVLPAEGAEAEFVGKMIVKQFEAQAARGVMELSGDAYQPSLLGAFKLVWNELPPMKQVRKIKEANETAAKLKALGFDSSGAFA